MFFCSLTIRIVKSLPEDVCCPIVAEAQVLSLLCLLITTPCTNGPVFSQKSIIFFPRGWCSLNTNGIAMNLHYFLK